MYVTVLGMKGIRRRCLVGNVTDAVGLLPGGCRLFDADCSLKGNQGFKHLLIDLFIDFLIDENQTIE